MTDYPGSKRLDRIAGEARRCRKCPGMHGRSAVLGPANGPATARLMFIAEAPGRLGADRTGIPLFGDRSGDNFQCLLDGAGLRRSDVFITNAVLCNPRDEHGKNRRPTAGELRNCLEFLRAQIDAVDPAIIAALGGSALSALGRIEAHGLELARDAGTIHHWRERLLVPLYHPSPLAAVHRPFALQCSDFAALASAMVRAPANADRTHQRS